MMHFRPLSQPHTPDHQRATSLSWLIGGFCAWLLCLSATGLAQEETNQDLSYRVETGQLPTRAVSLSNPHRSNPHRPAKETATLLTPSSVTPLPTSPINQVSEDTQESLEDLQKRIQDSQELNESQQSTALAHVEAALGFLKETAQWNQRETAEQQAAESAEKNAKKWKGQLDKLNEKTEKPASVPTDLSLNELEQKQRELTSEVTKLENEIQQLNLQRENRERDVQATPARKLELDSLLNELNTALQATPPQDEPSLLTEAQRAEQRTQRDSAIAELSAREKISEAADQDSRHDTLRTHLDLLTRQLTLKEEEVQKYQTRLATVREQETEDLLQQAGQDIDNAPPELVAFIQESANFAQKAHDLLEPTAKATRDKESIEQDRKKFREQYKKATERVNKIGLSESVGELLRKLLAELPNETWISIDVQGHHATVEELRFEQFDLDDARDDIPATAAELLASLETTFGLTESQKKELKPAAEEALANRRKYLKLANKRYDDYHSVLLDLEATETAFIDEIKQYRDYINQRILWIRSNRLLFSKIELDDSDRLVFSSSQWSNVWQALVADSRRFPHVYVGLGLLVGFLGFIRNRIRGLIERLGQAAGQGSCTDFSLTVRTGFASLLMAIAVPLIPLIIGWRFRSLGISNAEHGMAVLAALGPALLAVTWFFIPIELMRQVCRHHGLAEKHFTWPNSAILSLRSNLLWAIPVGAGLTFGIALLYFLDDVHRYDLLERSLFIIAMGLLAYLLSRVLHPQRGLFADYISHNNGSWAAHTRHLWYWLALGVPLLLAGATLFGYYYTALQLTSRVYTTLVWFIGISLVRAFLFRFILVRRRHVHIQAAQERRAKKIEKAQEEQKKRLEASASGETSSALSTDEATTPASSEHYVPIADEVDIDTSALQSSRFVSLLLAMVMLVGTWFIWVEVLPALRQLDEYAIWMSEPADSTSVADTSSDTQTETTSTSAESSSAKRVTVRDLLFALLIALITLVTTRNVPSMLEIMFLKQLPVDHSVRHAIKTLTSYAIVIIGVLLTFRAVSIGWTQVQWLMTALTFGLAFGLQEIFANFVAGIILLFERPIRIGDVVTVDDVTGVVSRIRTRATTITDWDRKEYVIPNRAFITGRMLNWTLSDKINRIVIEVGVAYGTDVEFAKQRLREICQQHPLTLNDPGTIVTFEGFGDNTLNLVVRTYLPDLDHRLGVIDELHSQINQVFEQEGIEISFPQRDLHVRSIDPNLQKLLVGTGNDST